MDAIATIAVRPRETGQVESRTGTLKSQSSALINCAAAPTSPCVKKLPALCRHAACQAQQATGGCRSWQKGTHLEALCRKRARTTDFTEIGAPVTRRVGSCIKSIFYSAPIASDRATLRFTSYDDRIEASGGHPRRDPSPGPRGRNDAIASTFHQLPPCHPRPEAQTASPVELRSTATACSPGLNTPRAWKVLQRDLPRRDACAGDGRSAVHCHMFKL